MFKRGDRVQTNSLGNYYGRPDYRGTIVSIHTRNGNTYYNILWDYCKKWNGEGHNWTDPELKAIVEPNSIIKDLLC